MTDAVSEVPVIEAAAAVAATIVNPSIPVLAEDLLLAHKIASEVKTAFAGKHPGVLDIFKLLFSLE